LRGRVKGIVGGSPGTTEIAPDIIKEIRARASERADVMRERFGVLTERRPRVFEALGVEETPLKAIKREKEEVPTHGASGTSEVPTHGE